MTLAFENIYTIFVNCNHKLLIHIGEARRFVFCWGNRQLTNVGKMIITFVFCGCVSYAICTQSVLNREQKFKDCEFRYDI